MASCPQCGEPLGAGDPAGLCPKCLIESAFASSAGANEFLTQTTELAGPRSAEDDFGRYQIVGLLGEGGMGSVFLAEQLEPIRRRVALKVVKLGMDTEQVLARFHNERQALARMDHPNIAQIFDAGATSKGRPYFVMEYIEGLPVTQYCDRKRMPTRDRLAIFLVVCRAVQHAHSKGVIHRDIKPSNVLVAERDGLPVPKVIDFGIAKATDKWAVESTLLTQFGQIVGTPEYASPEQADTMTGVIDEASDVYSLGVLLYELLIGAVPFDGAVLRNAGLAEMLRMIREEEAPPLPRKLTSMGNAASEIAERRRTDPATLRRLVDGDLNAITMKALEKTRDRRYPSVSELAADVHRHLDDQPVLASMPGTLHRFRKLLRRQRVAVLGTVAGVAFLSLGGVTAWLLTGETASRARLTDKDTLVLAEFENRTGDPGFDSVLRQGLSIEVQQSPFLALVAERKVQRTLALMGKPKDAKLDSETARQVCERTGGAAVLEGSISRVGSQYVIGLRAKDCAAGEVLDEQQAVAARKEDVLNALSEVARRFRTRAGESLATVERHSTPLVEATTSSFEAFKAYAEGYRLRLSTMNSRQAVALFLRAVEIDPAFALAHAHLGFAYTTAGELELGAEYTRKAWLLRDRVTDHERFFIDFLYHRQVTGDLESAYQTLELWKLAYPRRRPELLSPHDLLAGVSTHGTGRFAKTIEASLDGIAADPDFPIPYANLALAYFYTDRMADAERVIQQAAARNATSALLELIRYQIALFKGDRGATQQAAAQARARGEPPHRLNHIESLVLAREGRVEAARRLSKSAVEAALAARAQESAAGYAAARAVWEGLFGNAAQSRAAAVEALARSRGRDVQYAAGLALAVLGDIGRSDTIAEDLGKRFPEDTFVKFTYAPVLRGFGAQQRGRYAECVEKLEMTRAYEGAANGLNFPPFTMGGLHSAFVRGEALAAQKRFGEAAAEFQKIADHRGLTGVDPIGALAHLKLGRMHALAGDAAKARAAYGVFFAMWQDADPNVPVLRQARADFAKIQ